MLSSPIRRKNDGFVTAWRERQIWPAGRDTTVPVLTSSHDEHCREDPAEAVSSHGWTIY